MRKRKEKENNETRVEFGTIAELKEVFDRFDENSNVSIVNNDDEISLSIVPPMDEIKCNVLGSDMMTEPDNYNIGLQGLKIAGEDLPADARENYINLVSEVADSYPDHDFIRNTVAMDDSIIKFIDNQFEFIKANIANYIDVKNRVAIREMAHIINND